MGWNKPYDRLPTQYLLYNHVQNCVVLAKPWLSHDHLVFIML